MSAYPLRTATLAAAAMIGLSGCGYNGLYSGVSVGAGNGYYDPYYGYGYGAGYSRYGSRYGYGFDPYWGWYDGFYYPGSGYYVYDRYRRAYPWDRYRDYWEGRRERAMSSSEFRRLMEEQRAQQDQQNWSAFEQAPSRVQRIRQSDRRSIIQRDRSAVERNRSSRSERASTRSNRSSAPKQSASDFRRSQEENRGN